MLVTAKEMLLEAKQGKYAIGAFNVENMEMVMAVLAAAEAKNSPVIMQTTPGTIKYAGVDYYYANVAAAAARSKVPVVMHLDHGDSFDRAMAAYRAGYTSIMIDGSKLSLEENIALTKSVVDACHPGGVSVEGELGKVGGKEDDLDGGDDNPYTDPDEAKIFVEKTGVDYLAHREHYNAMAEKIVFTGPIDAYFGYRLGKLEYRSLRFETEVLDTDNYQGVAVVNYTDRETPYTRIIEHKHFEFGTQEKTVITREYPVAWSEGIEPYYTVNDDRNQALYAQYAQLAEKERSENGVDVIFGGRLGEYKYYDMDKVIEAAMLRFYKERTTF